MSKIIITINSAQHQEKQKNCLKIAQALLELVQGGHDLVVVLGQTAEKNDFVSLENRDHGAMSFWLEQSLRELIKDRKLSSKVASFKGEFLIENKNSVGTKAILEASIIRSLMESKHLVLITLPLQHSDSTMDAKNIDKNKIALSLAEQISAETFLILRKDFEKKTICYNINNMQEGFDAMLFKEVLTSSEAEVFFKFPKKEGLKAIIGSENRVIDAFNGKNGIQITF